MTDRIEHLDEGTIHAWLDGELPPDESARLESHANSCTDCAALVAEARGLVAASSRILASLDAVPAGVVPGSGKDQLAELRARRQAATRVWWRDRRWVAAASLILVAGVSSVVWRNVGDISPVAMESARSLDSAALPASAPVPAPAVPPTEAPSVRGSAPTRVLSRRADSATNAKVAANPVPGAAAGSRFADAVAPQRDVANAARARDAAVGATVPSLQQQAVDSTRAAARAEQSAFERKVQQQIQTPPTPPRIIPEQRQQGAANAPPPQSLSPRVADSGRVTSGAAAASRIGVTAASISAGARILDPESPAGRCYALTMLTPGEAQRTIAPSDTVQLLDAPVPGRTDPSLFRALVIGDRGAISSLAWRMVDSVTVEVLAVPASPSERLRAFPLRFRALPPGAQPPDVTGLAGVRAALAVRVDCR